MPVFYIARVCLLHLVKARIETHLKQNSLKRTTSQQRCNLHPAGVNWTSSRTSNFSVFRAMREIACAFSPFTIYKFSIEQLKDINEILKYLSGRLLIAIWKCNFVFTAYTRAQTGFTISNCVLIKNVELKEFYFESLRSFLQFPEKCEFPQIASSGNKLFDRYRFALVQRWITSSVNRFIPEKSIRESLIGIVKASC